MMELKVNLDFHCSVCESSMGVTLQCSGKGLLAGTRTVASVRVPCPSCGGLNQLYFEPCGIVRSVTPCRSPQIALEPSMN